MDQAEIKRQLAGVIINGDKYNVFVVEAFEHIKSNDELLRFLKDDAAAYQAYLALRDTDWITHTGDRYTLGWINCSALIGLLRGKGEHPQHMWWGEYERNPAPADPIMFERFDQLLIKSDWTVNHRIWVELQETQVSGM